MAGFTPNLAAFRYPASDSSCWIVFRHTELFFLFLKTFLILTHEKKNLFLESEFSFCWFPNGRKKRDFFLSLDPPPPSFCHFLEKNIAFLMWNPWSIIGLEKSVLKILKINDYLTDFFVPHQQDWCRKKIRFQTISRWHFLSNIYLKPHITWDLTHYVTFFELNLAWFVIKNIPWASSIFYLLA